MHAIPCLLAKHQGMLCNVTHLFSSTFSTVHPGAASFQNPAMIGDALQLKKIGVYAVSSTFVAFLMTSITNWSFSTEQQLRLVVHNRKLVTQDRT